MRLREFQPMMEEFFDRVDREGERSKDSQLALNELQALYLRLDDEERELANQVLLEWAETGDGHRQFHALALIDRLSIRSALPVLRRLADRFERADGPSAPYDWAWVNRIIGRLVEPDAATAPDGPDEPR